MLIASINFFMINLDIKVKIHKGKFKTRGSDRTDAKVLLKLFTVSHVFKKDSFKRKPINGN